MVYSNTRKYGFAANVEDWVSEVEGLTLLVLKESIDETVNTMQVPKPDGGRMPVKTGFLRSTGLSSLNGWPSGPDDKPKDAAPNSFDWDGESVTTTLDDMKQGDTFYFGWTAVYALKQEVYNGFLDTAAQNWQTTVDANVRKLRDE
jgi:hypothetical protein